MIATAMALSACQKERWGRDKVEDSGFVDLVAQLKLATAVCGGDLAKANEARRVLLHQHAMTPESFHRNYRYLMDHPENWKAFHEQVVERLDFYQTKAKGGQDGH